MKSNKKLKLMASATFAGLAAASTLHAQTQQPYQGVVGRTLAESKE